MSGMTDDQIVNLVSKWQTRLKLDHWNVEVEIVKPGQLGRDAGQVNYDYQYLNAWMKLDRKDVDGRIFTLKELSHNIIHELIHLHLSGMGVVAGTKEHTAEEQAVQCLTRVIIEGYSK